MLLFLLAYLGGVLTILSPCVLPVLPFVFARADRPFVSSGLPLLVGMTIVFALVATLAALAGGWAVAANQYGRIVAIVLLAGFGLTLLFPTLGDRVMRPVVALGAHLSNTAQGGAMPQRQSSVWSSLLLGAATGLLWAPCAGPVLGLILTGAALNGASVGTTLLLLAYAAGAATSLGLALLAGGRVFAAMKRSIGAGEWIRRGLGAAVLVAVVAIAFGADTGFLTRVSAASTAAIEQRLLNRFGMKDAAPVENVSAEIKGPLPVEGQFPSIDGGVEWLNSPPLTNAELKGKVVLVDFWTYSCINCLRTIPYVRAWADKYKDDGLVVIGVHAPEFAFEKDVGNVKKAVADLGITYPVAVDNNYAIWRAFKNSYWPAHYFIDAQGRIRHHHFGEGSYAESERVIQDLLAEAGKPVGDSGLVAINSTGAEAAPDPGNIKSPETYIGYGRAENFASPGGFIRDVAQVYSATAPMLNDWALGGSWTVNRENATLNDADGSVVFRFHARDLHLVLGPGPDGKPVRFRVKIDGAAPGESHGADVDASGEGTVTSERLYQLVRQSGPVTDRTFEIEFLDPGVRAYSFTFG